MKVTTREPPPFSRVDSAAQFTVTKLDDLINWAHRVSALAFTLCTILTSLYKCISVCLLMCFTILPVTIHSVTLESDMVIHVCLCPVKCYISICLCIYIVPRQTILCKDLFTGLYALHKIWLVNVGMYLIFYLSRVLCFR